MRSGNQAVLSSSSEDMFLAWVLSLSENASVADAARLEIARIDRIDSPGECMVRLRDMLLQATMNQPCSRRSRKRLRH